MPLFYRLIEKENHSTLSPEASTKEVKRGIFQEFPLTKLENLAKIFVYSRKTQEQTSKIQWSKPAQATNPKDGRMPLVLVNIPYGS